MKPVVVVTLLALAACSRTQSAAAPVIERVELDPAHIDADVPRVVQGASKGNKRVLVFFHAEWCEPCRNIAPAFTRDGNRSTFARWNLAEVDVDRMQGSRALGLDVEYIPLVVKLDAQGRVAGTLDGESFGDNPRPEHVDEVFRAFLGS